MIVIFPFYFLSEIVIEWCFFFSDIQFHEVINFFFSFEIPSIIFDLKFQQYFDHNFNQGVLYINLAFCFY